VFPLKSSIGHRRGFGSISPDLVTLRQQAQTAAEKSNHRPSVNFYLVQKEIPNMQFFLEFSKHADSPDYSGQRQIATPYTITMPHTHRAAFVWQGMVTRNHSYQQC
jgi:hypothetical protein